MTKRERNIPAAWSAYRSARTKRDSAANVLAFAVVFESDSTPPPPNRTAESRVRGGTRSIRCRLLPVGGDGPMSRYRAHIRDPWRFGIRVNLVIIGACLIAMAILWWIP